MPERLDRSVEEPEVGDEGVVSVQVGRERGRFTPLQQRRIDAVLPQRPEPSLHLVQRDDAARLLARAGVGGSPHLVGLGASGMAAAPRAGCCAMRCATPRGAAGGSTPVACCSANTTAESVSRSFGTACARPAR
eukprot:6617652-Prymnesium_polylepis.1